MSENYSGWMTTTVLSMNSAEHGNEIMDNFFNRSPIMKAIEKHGGMESKNTGDEFTWPVQVEGGTMQWFGRGSKYSDTTPDPVRTANWHMKFAQLPVKVLYVDEVKNKQSKTKIFDYVKSLKDCQKDTARDEMDRAVMRATPLTNSIHSIPELVKSTGTIGGIAYDDYEDVEGDNLWASPSSALGSFAAGGLDGMSDMCIDLNDNGADIDVIFMPTAVYKYYLKAAEDKHILTNQGTKMGFGIGKVPFNGIPIEASSKVASGSIYYLDLSTFKVRKNPGATHMTPWIDMENEPARKAHYMYCMQVYIKSRRKNGYHTGVTA